MNPLPGLIRDPRERATAFPRPAGPSDASPSASHASGRELCCESPWAQSGACDLFGEHCPDFPSLASANLREAFFLPPRTGLPRGYRSESLAFATRIGNKSPAGLRRSIRIAALPSSSPPLVYDGGRRPLQLLIGQATATRCTWAPGTSRAAHQAAGRSRARIAAQLFRRDAERAVRVGAPGRGGNLRAAPACGARAERGDFLQNPINPMGC